MKKVSTFTAIALMFQLLTIEAGWVQEDVDNSDSSSFLLMDNDFQTGFCAGVAAQVISEFVRNSLPEYADLYNQTGICRDRLTAYATVLLGTLGVQKAAEQKVNMKHVAGVITGALTSAVARNLIFGDPHVFVK